ncbi:HlyD family type I secretion periplasmic adaptor subunit [Maritimibacter sp. DP07]|jgi:adhesin transport system membrane fusion protein|uniref:Membrane fusion protein (MFP) family protein n=1 Tax=Maritimibacter harenae TaxID=2606218 RepID=A0A845M9D1_9RHOB|nr:HlyD family type I secretion periplasmic adaptor subunit [Maritimibacter harenae]MZR14637.1 HlyD family type I secretion periplasmic adaptor subunit [Maritimibacter harenae]
MFGPSVDEDFVNRAGVRPQGEGRGGTLLLAALVAGIAGFLWWAAVFEIEEVTRGQGRVVPSQQVQVIQSLEGGIVREILVDEGETVEPDAPLIRIDDTTAGARRGELLEQEAALLAERLRVRTEAEGGATLAFPESLTARAPEAVAAEREVFASRRSQLSSELDVLNDQLSQRRAELGEARAMIAKLEGQIAPLAEEVRLTRGYVDSGAITQIELLRLETRLAELEGELAVSRARLPRLEAAIAEAENQIETSRRAYVLTARERLARVQAELSVLRETLRAAQDRVTRTTLRAPVRGIVNTVNVATIGAVVGPGDPLIEIVPVDDHLLVEARITPQDVAFIRPGDPASVKITAFDYTVYGSLQGTVQRIGADTVTDADGNAFFQVTIRTDETALGGNPISPGMVAQIDIQTGRKTVLDYLLNPFLRVGSEALRER